MISFSGKAFYSRYTLQEHQNTHGEARPYLCTLCGATFKTKGSLQTHIQGVHKGKNRKPQDESALIYGCEVCGRKFHNHAILKKHMITHSTERPFACSSCGDTFKTAEYLKSHIDCVHLGKRRKPADESECKYSCEICGRRFHLIQDIHRHR
jgi:KRAB domain-containing zinc finger protein